MNSKLGLILLLCCLLTACHTMQRYEWVGAPVLKGAGGFMKQDDGLEIWISGEPDREYIPIKIVETMTSGTIGVESYLFGVLKKEAREQKGEGFILLTKDAQSGGAIVTGGTTTTGYGSIYGNRVATQSTTSGSAVVIPIQYNTFRALIFRYKDKATKPDPK